MADCLTRPQIPQRTFLRYEFNVAKCNDASLIFLDEVGLDTNPSMTPFIPVFTRSISMSENTVAENNLSENKLQTYINSH